jgi:hypothetical protein
MMEPTGSNHPFDPQMVDSRPARERELVLAFPKQIAGLDPIKWGTPCPELPREFSSVLEKARDEKPLQMFFEAHPAALLTALVQPHTGWVIPRPKLPKPDGGGWVPDFIICEWSSVGPDWIIVELESPIKSPLTKTGKVSAICNHAAEQINDYKSFIRDHGYYLRANGWPKLHAECSGVIVIGRRDPIRSKHADKLEAFRRQRIEVASYDRLLEHCELMQRVLSRGASSASDATT